MLLKNPEVVKFDANVKGHREAAKAFLKRTAWADTKMRFAHDPAYGSVSEQVQSKLLHWYIGQENVRSNPKLAVV
jgi:hypothetical protein